MRDYWAILDSIRAKKFKNHLKAQGIEFTASECVESVYFTFSLDDKQAHYISIYFNEL